MSIWMARVYVLCRRIANVSARMPMGFSWFGQGFGAVANHITNHVFRNPSSRSSCVPADFSRDRACRHHCCPRPLVDDVLHPERRRERSGRSKHLAYGATDASGVALARTPASWTWTKCSKRSRHCPVQPRGFRGCVASSGQRTPEHGLQS